jgi:hypothetical protein
LTSVEYCSHSDKLAVADEACVTRARCAAQLQPGQASQKGFEYDREECRERIDRQAERAGGDHHGRAAQGAIRDFQNGPKIPRPNVAATFIPVVGPAWQAAADLQDRNYAGAATNAALAVSDLSVADAVARDMAKGGLYAIKAGQQGVAACRATAHEIVFRGAQGQDPVLEPVLIATLRRGGEINSA